MSRSTTVDDFCARKFDYVICGGGTAGLVVAARLSQDSNIQVGVLEAGTDGIDDPIIYVPGRFGEAIGTKYDWAWKTVPQPGLGGRQLDYARGKVLGGSSAINFFTWMRGNREDYDAWEELGNEGWGWESLLPFFKMAEKLHAPDAELAKQHNIDVDPSSHGENGPIQTVYSREHGGSHKFWHETMQNLGAERRPTFNGSNVGVWTALTSVDPTTWRRSYAGSAYYLPNASRSNLAVLCNAMVRGVVLEGHGDNVVATGVRFAYGGQEYTVQAKAEVIVCGGSINSPQILELSGIGDPNVLNAAGIPVKVENPNVGENLQDRLMTCAVFEIDPTIQTREDLIKDPGLSKAAALEYEQTKSGPLTVLPCSMSYLPLTFMMSPEEITVIAKKALGALDNRQQILLRKLTSEKPLGQIEFVFDANNWYPVFPQEPGKKYGTILQMLQYPFTRGSIHIPPAAPGRTTTSDDGLVIDPRYYQDDGELDFAVFKATQAFADKIPRTEPLSSIVRERVWPPPSVDLTEKEDFTNYIRDHTISDWHPVGTCAMGGKNGKSAGVVDERLRVYGVKRMRVIDASIMPLQISAHLQATVYAIAEKGASMILEGRVKGGD
ncbi:GMC oxidoreductase [Patellaria atrata CBS 101060]|uniref:GMC oxidoreductase n=1 Tax=Patellaria atrata CBS 101060 TaxID=1346257 RepID=A0A9P4S8X6_9PEZI|nr:GMC oxidoreductase [Patellaria atrata CBS 101060]